MKPLNAGVATIFAVIVALFIYYWDDPQCWGQRPDFAPEGQQQYPTLDVIHLTPDEASYLYFYVKKHQKDASSEFSSTLIKKLKFVMGEDTPEFALASKLAEQIMQRDYRWQYTKNPTEEQKKSVDYEVFEGERKVIAKIILKKYKEWEQIGRSTATE